MTPADTESSDRALEKLLREINEISTLPHIVSRVMQVANSLETSAADLMKIIETDAALSTRVLRCVNSAAYGLRNRITSLQHAISYMGFKQVVNLAVSAAVCDIFQGDAKVGPYSRLILWRHVVSVAVVSRMIAIRQKMQNFEEAFLAGLLHDIGIILEDQYAHEPFVQMMESLVPGRYLIHAEREALGFDHALLGARMADMWKLPEAIVHVTRYHHDTVRGYTGPHAKILSCVELANVLCTLKGIGSTELKLVELSPEVLKHLSVDQNDLRVLAEDMDHELKLHEELVKLVES